MPAFSANGLHLSTVWRESQAIRRERMLLPKQIALERLFLLEKEKSTDGTIAVAADRSVPL